MPSIPDQGLRLGLTAVFLLAAAAPDTSSAQDAIKRVKIDLAYVEEIAQRLAQGPYRPDAPRGEDASAMKILSALKYDQYRAIRFLPERAIWKSENLNFQMHLFHLGYLFTQPVHINEFTHTHCQRLRFVQDFFDYSRSGMTSSLPPTLGYAGLRLHFPLNKPDVFDEAIVFQGASYFRALGKGNVYGLSSRGLALNCALPGITEEFPIFREFWVGKPEGTQRTITIFALLDSDSVAGAYQFDIAPGDPTTVAVHASLFFRKVSAVVGVSPFSSMFWFGENSRQRFDDYRPEVHDSDGLAIRTASGECMWRPTSNNPPRIETHSFKLHGVKGFGLLQRDRSFANYQDLEALYHQRPSIWVEPTSDWGPGEVRLVELPTQEELADNVVVYWIPDATPQPLKPFRYSYRQTWGMMENPAGAACWTVATRSGTHPWAPGVRFMIVEFDGPRLRELPSEKPPDAVVTVANGAPVSVENVRTLRNPFNGIWRASFEVRPASTNTPPAQIGPIELRCCLKSGEDYLSETWTYRTQL
ncbi:MAG TPA: glucan biosynthesis protein G [Verrucomicrobiae bacterium]|nr:glucan biosynthesis protein G [Verrucomicrobiae bacterium]